METTDPGPGTTSDRLVTFLKDEYVMLEQFYEDVDHRCLIIKGWSVTVTVGAIGAGLIYTPYAYVGALAAALLFWHLEAFYRSLSFFFAARIQTIEQAFREGSWSSLPPLQVYSTWNDTHGRTGSQTWKYLLKSATRMPHLFVALASVVLLVLWMFGVEVGARGLP